MPASLGQTSSRTSQKTIVADLTTNNKPEPEATTVKSGHAKRGRESEGTAPESDLLPAKKARALTRTQD